MRVHIDQCERVRVALDGHDIIAFMGLCAPTWVELTLIDQSNGQAWHSKFVTNQSARRYFASQPASYIAELLSTSREADRVLIARTAQQHTIAQRRLRALSPGKARALFNAAASIPGIESEDDWPEAVLEVAYGLDWRVLYPKLRDPAFEALLQHVTLLQQALNAYPA